MPARERFASTPIRTVAIPPGMVGIKMTASIPKGALVSSPEAVAEDICRTLNSGRDVRYTPWLWLSIMMIINLLPWPIVKRLNLYS